MSLGFAISVQSFQVMKGTSFANLRLNAWISLRDRYICFLTLPMIREALK